MRSLSNKSVLVVDQDPEILVFLSQLFEGRKLRALRARSKSEALDLLGRDYIPVDLVLANMMTTRMDGPEFCREVAEIRQDVPVIFMSAYVESGVIRIEAMKPLNISGYSGADERGLLKAVLSALKGGETCAQGSPYA